MKASGLFLVFIAHTLLSARTSSAAHEADLQSKYPFYRTLFDAEGQYYGLYWNFSIAAQTIHFAVNVSSTGWVGLGVSPNGQMPRSDVVIGWVAENDGGVYFHDRYAEFRSLPPIDESQDWFLISGEEEGGFTILEFSRNLTTCDPKDLEIKADTARVIWSFSVSDPTDSLGNTALQHDYQGVVSINLLSGLVEPPAEPSDLLYLDIVVANVTIPRNDTTYWCQSIEIGEDFQASTKYIIRTSPRITQHTHSFVHHMLIYLCPYALDEDLVGESGPCEQVHQNVSNCRNGIPFGAWAVGGEDFTYPENVAYPVGGPGAGRHIVIEMHYDNPDMEEGVIDNSGMRFFYTSTPREHDAGMLTLGYTVSSLMIIPPRANNFTISGLCTATCTKKYLPDTGIHIFGIFLHTHLAGRALELQHFRLNTECNVLEELEPIVYNPSYDFDYQQFLYLPKEVTVLPGDVLVSRCIYGTTDRPGVTFGGLSTREEMCLITPVFYPRPNNMPSLDYCISSPVEPYSFQSFEDKIRARNPEVSALWDQGQIVEGLNAIDWSSDTIQDLENTVTSGLSLIVCASEDDYTLDYAVNGVPQPNCSYQAPDKCTSFEPKSCCERLESGAPRVVTQMPFFITTCLILISMLLTTVIQ